MKNRILRAGIYDPYLDTLGGGERYCLSVAEILLNNGYNVDLFWSGDKSFLSKAEIRFSLDLKKVNIVPDIFDSIAHSISFFEDKNALFNLIHRSKSPLKIRDKIIKTVTKILTTKKYDLIFYLSDGSNPFLFAKKNILHVQVPFTKKELKYNDMLNNIKGHTYNHIVCNSQFTAKFTQKFFKKKVDILYPPVDINKFDISTKKENIILNVGRFDNILNSKKQDILIPVFKKLIKNKEIEGWKLIFAGGSTQSPDQNSYLNLLKQESQGFPIEFHINPDFDTLKSLYAKSKIYWHAAGYNVKQNIHPENTEHFGMTIVESMASGCIPIVIAKGGIPEIISNGIDGFTWLTLNGLYKKTKNLILNQKLFDKIKSKSILNSKKFSKENFETQLLSLISTK
jgi:glycosyltransferase involved in cell wall biosynthesis